jgi:hypothetical protein
LYKVDSNDLQDPNGQGSLLVEFSECLGTSEFKFVEGPEFLNTTLTDLQQMSYENHGKKSVYLSLPRPKSLYIMVAPVGYDQSKSKEKVRTDFMLKA